jgi:HAD superfamily hydrolase (TIGR01450 family)
VTSWVFDLDGVIWLADQPIAGAAEAVAQVRARGDEVVFVSNNSQPTIAEYEAKLASFGIPATDAVVSSSSAAAQLITSGETVLVLGGPGVVEAVTGRGATVVEDGDVDTVMVGFHREFDYDRMRRAATAVRRGARLIATNDDATYPTPGGPIPGAGSILASIERASGMHAVVAGKPYPPMVALVRDRLGPDGVVVGDRPDTDGRFARALGYRFALVLSGVTAAGDIIDPRPDVVASDLGALVAQNPEYR